MSLHFRREDAAVYVPDGRRFEQAVSGVTRLGIGAHPDDTEFMAYHGIEACYGSMEEAFAGVVCTNGAGSSRIGPYANYTDEQMQQERWKEQKAAAAVGRYAFVAQFNYPSSDVKAPGNTDPDKDLLALLKATRPHTVYTHNPADKHATHVAVSLRVVRVLRNLPRDQRPRNVYGCEIWRDLDWMPDAKKQRLNAGNREHLALALSSCFDSQISGGKRYDLGIVGRRRAQATFLESHEPDKALQLTLAMDLSPLVDSPSITPEDYVSGLIEAFQAEVRTALRPWT